jgi:alkylation response protein AidB-like acyl-CoA dehydrogenase
MTRLDLQQRVARHEAIGAQASPDPVLAFAEAELLRQALDVAPGPARTCVAWHEDAGDLLLEHDADVSQLSGQAPFVAGAPEAAQILVCARSAHGVVVLVLDPASPGTQVTRLDALGGEPVGALQLDHPALAPQAWLVSDDATAAVGEARARAAVLACAELAGAAHAALDFAVAHAKQREQFGRPIGSFQAVQHHLARMRVDADAARLAARDAAVRIDAGEPASIHAALAKLACAPAARRVVATAHQVVGGAGLYADAPLHRWYRRVKALEWRGGMPQVHAALLADDLGL